MKPKPWLLPKVLERDRNAATVYLALQWLGKGNRQVNATRKTINGVCGLCNKRITSAVTALQDAKWLSRGYGRRGSKSWYRIVLAVSTGFPEGQKMTHRERRKPLPLKDRKGPTGKRAEGKKMSLRDPRPCRSENDPPSLEGGGASYGTAPSLDSPGRAAAPRISTATEIERKRMKAIRGRREAIKRGEIEPTEGDSIPWLPKEDPATKRQLSERSDR